MKGDENIHDSYLFSYAQDILQYLNARMRTKQEKGKTLLNIKQHVKIFLNKLRKTA